ncbi:MAG: GAF domain-containing protein [Deltaproteobacteria bacterium]|nr:GAF domain-containing protein [Deltaproteobacteria bacterium]
MPRTDSTRLAGRYARIHDQLALLFHKTEDPLSRMATAAAALHHKMPHFFWTGFYRMEGGDLIVGPYQGPLACSVLVRGRGVCWASVERGEALLVPDVHAFSGHIACDSRSRSEVVVPVRARDGHIAAVLDVDGREKDAFCQVDVDGLSRIATLIHMPFPELPEGNGGEGGD